MGLLLENGCNMLLQPSCGGRGRDLSGISAVTGVVLLVAGLLRTASLDSPTIASRLAPFITLRAVFPESTRRPVVWLPEA